MQIEYSNDRVKFSAIGDWRVTAMTRTANCTSLFDVCMQ